MTFTEGLFLGLGIGLLISGLVAMLSFRLGWNARGRYQARRALESIRQKHDAAKPLFRH